MPPRGKRPLEKNCDKISKERRVFESGSPMILGTKPWVLREIGR